MSELYPFLLLPEFVERVWGARDLSPVYEHRRAAGQQPVGEVWLTGEDCRVANGPLAGLTLSQLTQKFGRELVGEASPQADRFPLLIKFLFPRQKLSVQVHPDDEGARRVGQPCGKTECWYIVAAEMGAQVALGLKAGVTREQFREAIEQKRAEKLLNWIYLNAGDMIYVDAGTVHAIGPGSVIVETQQYSDTTYRLYDYGRDRELHVAQGLAATKEKTLAGKVARNGSHSTLLESPYFVIKKHSLAEGKEHVITRHMPPTSVQLLVALEGCGAVSVQGHEPVTFARGQAVAVPAGIRNFAVRPQWQLEYMHISLPQGQVDPPVTKL